MTRICEHKVELPLSDLVSRDAYLLSPYDPDFLNMHKLKDEMNLSEFEILVVIDEISIYTEEPYRSVWAVETGLNGDLLALPPNSRFRFVTALYPE